MAGYGVGTRAEEEEEDECLPACSVLRISGLTCYVCMYVCMEVDTVHV